VGHAPPVTSSLSQIIASLEIAPDSPQPPRIQKAIALARRLQERGASLQTREERRQQRELEKMVASAEDKATLTQMTDQAFRARTPSRVADQLTHILDVQGVPRFFSTLDRTLLKGFQSFGSYLPGVSIPLVKDKMREETANVILPAEKEVLARHLEERRRSRVRMNVNFLGEALLGEEDAQARLESYLAALQMPEIEVISVKATTIYSQIAPISRRHAEKVLCDRLELLYRAAAKARYERIDGTKVAKFVYLDMEEYRDLWVTVEAFVKTLSRPGLENVDAGIALQAYVPDSWHAQQRINEWARERVEAGGSPVTIRLVKGANMEAERVEASIAGWPQGPYQQKIDTDANYKRMLESAIEAIDWVRLGVATHNLFEVAYALVLVEERECHDKVQFEMLEGMANHQRRALAEMVENILLYAPATRREEFVNAIGYLIRRLDENTGPQNFLRHAFKLEVGSDEWNDLEAAFVASWRLKDEVSNASRRTQDRNGSEPLLPIPRPEDFDNDPHTDFSLEQNLRWAESIVTQWKPRFGEAAIEVPVVVAGDEILADREVRESLDPSRPGTVVARYRHANDADIDRALGCASDDPSGWRSMGEAARMDVLARVAQALGEARGDLMGAALADGGKLLTESDPEVSEAIDFARYYASTARYFRELDTVEAKPKGVVVVVPPWNFPIAIPCGGVAAALAAGNCVILKPASDTVLTAYELCKCFWRAGVPKEALQFLPCSGARGGARLVASEAVDAVILTGGTSTALRMIEGRPTMNLCAETGGKNATIITAMSDRELAIKHVIYSAFGHSGQKCSATSLLILEGEVYDDPGFKKTLVDAVRSLAIGSAWELHTKMGPVVHPPDSDLERGLKELETGESWAVMPRTIDDNPCLWTPAVKWGVAPGSYPHLTEFFGPVLSVMRANDLEHAIELVNQTGYGLTSGLESLDEREQALWRDSIRAGNLYINRGTTGAIVLRQPFGGMGKSAFGPGIKAGGPNYVAQFFDFVDRSGQKVSDEPVASPEVEELRRALVAARDDGSVGLSKGDIEATLRAIASYDRWYAEEFGVESDHFRLVGQDNIRRYLPVRWLRVRVTPSDSAFEIMARVAAAKTAGCTITVSLPPGHEPPAVSFLDRVTEGWGAAIEFVEESDEEIARVIARHDTDRVRYAGDRAPRVVLESVGETGIYVSRQPVLAEGRIELLWYLTEQSISHDYHRYGNLGARSTEPRRPVD
jgi:RHH-type transcriptional regulator, proline utilization regulon repressor / proline dehydrogenase / delta 1-pyrroline-5-carboxylate dehydrogenase